jgi:hypothetical protein
MSRGYLVMAQGPQYATQAEHLARSIIKSQTTVNKLSVITDQKVDHTLFDHVINLSIDLKPESTWKIENRAQFYDLTPYSETVILDSDMLFLSDVSHWWDLMDKYELLLTSKVHTYRNQIVDQNNPYRKAFTKNQMPNVYSAFTYFKKTPLVQEFFLLVKSIILNWDSWIHKFTPNFIQPFPSMDLAMAMAVKILDIEDVVTTRENFPTFTHMKSQIQGCKIRGEAWGDTLGVYHTEHGIKIGPYLQSGILHYVKKDLI